MGCQSPEALKWPREFHTSARDARPALGESSGPPGTSGAPLLKRSRRRIPGPWCSGTRRRVHCKRNLRTHDVSLVCVVVPILSLGRSWEGFDGAFKRLLSGDFF